MHRILWFIAGAATATVHCLRAAPGVGPELVHITAASLGDDAYDALRYCEPGGVVRQHAASTARYDAPDGPPVMLRPPPLPSVTGPDSAACLAGLHYRAGDDLWGPVVADLAAGWFVEHFAAGSGRD